MIDKDLIDALENRDEEHPSIARLIELGRKKSYVTIDDILAFFPEAETDVDQLEEAFAALSRFAADLSARTGMKSSI